MKPQSKDKNQANNIVAVKIIRNKKRFHAQALTEIKILEKLMQLVRREALYPLSKELMIIGIGPS